MGTEQVAAASGEDYDRLVEFTTEWDPDSLFRLPSNADPTGGV